MDRERIEAVTQEGQKLRRRLLGILIESPNDSVVGTERLYRLPWPWYHRTRTYDPILGHPEDDRTQTWIRLEIRSNGRLVEVEFGDESDSVEIFCDGGEVLSTKRGETVHDDTGDAALELLMNVNRDFEQYDPAHTPWNLKRPERRLGNVRDHLLLQTI